MSDEKLSGLPLLSALGSTSRFYVAHGGSQYAVVPHTITPVFDIRAYGAVDGADCTTAIRAAMAAAAATSPRGVVYFPAGTWKATGEIDFSGLHGITFAGEAAGGSVIDIAHASTSLFVWSSTTNDVTLRDLMITSSVTRTGGWVLRGPTTYTASGKLQFSRIENLTVLNQVNGVWLSQYRYIWMHTCLLHSFVAGGGVGVGVKLGQTAATDVNQGVEARIHNVHVVGQNLYTQTGSDPTNLGYGFWIEDCDAVYLVDCHGLGVLENDLRLVAGGHGLFNHFFFNCVWDATRNSHGVVLTGSGPTQWIDFHGGYYAGAGLLTGGSTAAHGIHIDNAPLFVKIQDARIRKHTGSGIYISTSGACNALISGCEFSENGYGATASDNHNLYVSVGTNQSGPVIRGCKDSVSNPANGEGLRTSATTTLISVRDNVWPTGWVYGATPQDSNGNRAAASSTTRSVTTTVATAADTNETTLWSETLKGGVFSRDGQAVRVTAWGTCAANGNTKTLRFYVGANVVTINDITGAPNAVQWVLEAIVTRTGAATGKRIKRAIVANVPQGTSGTVSVAETWSGDVLFKITGQNGTASAGDINIQHVLWEPVLDV